MIKQEIVQLWQLQVVCLFCEGGEELEMSLCTPYSRTPHTIAILMVAALFGIVNKMIFPFPLHQSYFPQYLCQVKPPPEESGINQ